MENKMNEQEELIPKPQPYIKWEGVVYTEERVFYGAGVNPYHYTYDGIKTLCNIKCSGANWKRKEGKISEIDCKRCLKKLK